MSRSRLKSNLATPRYGRALRQRYHAIRTLQRQRYDCKSCFGLKTVTRGFTTGVWRCKKCNLDFVGVAYNPYP